MSDTLGRVRRGPPTASLVAGALVIAGLGLLQLSWWFFGVVALGAFGPGILRELGWLADHDELQRRAAHRAGYHAYLTCGLVACVLIAYVRSGERAIKDPEELATLFLALLWFTWFLSSLVAYWGAQATAVRLLLGFGTCWLGFTVLSNVGPEWAGWTALIVQSLLTIPFFGLAWLATRWPRVAGVLLLAVCVFFFQFFGLFGRSNLGLITQAVTFILFIGPLLASGVALLAGEEDDAAEADDPHDAAPVRT